MNFTIEENTYSVEYDAQTKEHILWVDGNEISDETAVCLEIECEQALKECLNVEEIYFDTWEAIGDSLKVKLLFECNKGKWLSYYDEYRDLIKFEMDRDIEELTCMRR